MSEALRNFSPLTHLSMNKLGRSFRNETFTRDGRPTDRRNSQVHEFHPQKSNSRAQKNARPRLSDYSLGRVLKLPSEFLIRVPTIAYRVRMTF